MTCQSSAASRSGSGTACGRLKSVLPATSDEPARPADSAKAWLQPAYTDPMSFQDTMPGKWSSTVTSIWRDSRSFASACRRSVASSPKMMFFSPVAAKPHWTVFLEPSLQMTSDSIGSMLERVAVAWAIRRHHSSCTSWR